jgi:hypothetical protein
MEVLESVIIGVGIKMQITIEKYDDNKFMFNIIYK